MSSDVGFLLKADFEYPHSKQIEHNDLPLYIERERFGGAKFEK